MQKSSHNRQTAFEPPNLSIKQSVTPVHKIHELLDRRKNATSRSSLASLIEDYGMEPELLDHLADVVNSPSVRAGTGVQFIHTDTGEKTPGMTVRATLSFSTQPLDLIISCDPGPVGQPTP